MAEEFRSRGFPGERSIMDWIDFERLNFEDRAVTWSASIDALSQVRREGVPLGVDTRYAWPAFGRIGVGADVTSVVVFQQVTSVPASGGAVVRDIDETSPKPETSSTLNIATVPLKQVASVQTNVPNVYLAQPSFNTVIESDLRLAINNGLDLLVLTELAKAGFQAPASDPLLVSIRAAITTLRAAGYAPDTLILDPQTDEDLDTLVATPAAGEEFYVFTPGQASPGTIFGLNRRVAKDAPAPIVVDSQAFGKLYGSPVSLARFEENAGGTNTSTVRLEGHAAFGTERVAAALRIAAS